MGLQEADDVQPQKCKTMSVGLKRTKFYHEYTMLGETLAQV